MFPYRDENPRVMTPVVTVALVGITAAVWILYQGAGVDPRLSASVCELGAVPGRIFGGELVPVMTPRGPLMVCGEDGIGLGGLLTSIFLHGGWFHFIGNMWFLWIFGDNVEDSMGHGRFVVFYLVTGVVASLAQVLTTPGSSVPLVGASGAISGVMGAYLLLYPRVRVHTLIVLGFIITRAALPAWAMLGYWIVIQVVGTLGSTTGGGGTAFLAHLGGFIAGMVLIRFFADPALVAQHRSRPVVRRYR